MFFGILQGKADSEPIFKVDYLFFIVFLIIGLFVVVSVIQHFITISQEMQRINIEIKRTRGSEKRHWKKKKRRLLWSMLPFIKY